MRGNMPSSAAALADWPTSSIQPPSVPNDFRTAHTLMTIAAAVPSASARRVGERRVRTLRSSSFGSMPMMTVRAQHVDDRGHAQADQRGERHVALRVLDDARGDGRALDAHVGPQRHRGGPRDGVHIRFAAHVPARREGRGVEPEPAEQRDAEDRDEAERHRPGLQRADHARAENVRKREQPDHGGGGDDARRGRVDPGKQLGEIADAPRPQSRCCRSSCRTSRRSWSESPRTGRGSRARRHTGRPAADRARRASRTRGRAPPRRRSRSPSRRSRCCRPARD